MRSIRAFFFLCLLPSCASSCASQNTDRPKKQPPPPPKVVVYASPTGNDKGVGTEADPFQTISRALDERNAEAIRLLPGIYEEEEVTVTRPVMLLGADEGASTLRGHLFINSDSVIAHRLNVLNGVAINLAEKVEVKDAVISPGREDNTVSVVSANATLSGLSMMCGHETCVQATTSTITITDLKAEPHNAHPSKRGIRVESSSVSISRLDMVGMGTTQVQADQRSYLKIETSTITGGEGNGLVVLRSRAVADRLAILDTRQIGLLIQTSDVRFRDGYVTGSGSHAVGISGGVVEVVRTVLEGSPEGAVTISNHTDRTAEVVIIDGQIRHERGPGVLIASGTLRMSKTHLIGDPDHAGEIDGADAITASGIDTRITLEGIRIEHPLSVGVSLANDASGTVTATVHHPRLAGVTITQAAAEAIVLKDLFVDHCGGSGIALFDARRVTIEGGRISRCPEAGLLAGQSSSADVRGASFINNTLYGIAAFGGSILRVESSAASGSKWATYASCGDGARVEDLGNNQYSGPTTTCP